MRSREQLMLPGALAFQSPSHEGQDENSNFEFVAEVRGYSEAQRTVPSSSHSSGRQRRGQEKDLFLLAGWEQGYESPMSTLQGSGSDVTGGREILPHPVSLEVRETLLA